MEIKSNPYLTLLTIVFGLLLIDFIFDVNTLIYISLILSGLGILSFRFLKLIELFWFKLSFLLSKIMPNILLFLVFIIVLTPLALFSKLFNVQSEFKSLNNQKSFFVRKYKKFNKKSFEKAW